jgi:hypothetical protein
LKQVERIRAALEAADFDLWFDREQLTLGSDWKQKIYCNLRECLFFLPMISLKTEAADFDRYFREEWAQAGEMVRRSDRSHEFVLPIKLDQGPHVKVPEEFPKKQWALVRTAGTETEFADDMKSLIAQLAPLVAQRKAEHRGP